MKGVFYPEKNELRIYEGSTLSAVYQNPENRIQHTPFETLIFDPEEETLWKVEDGEDIEIPLKVK